MASDLTPNSADEADEPTFEHAISELQTIVGQLEDGSLPLEESMQQFERGVSLLRGCYQVLEQAEQRIEILTSMDADGSVETEPFDASSTLEQQQTANEDATPKPRAGRKRSSPRDDASSLF